MRIGLWYPSEYCNDLSDIVSKCGHSPIIIDSPKKANNIDGLIISGRCNYKEDMIILDNDIFNAVKKIVQNNTIPIFGINIGVVLLAKNIKNLKIKTLALMDIEVSVETHNNICENELLFVPALGIKRLKFIHKGINILINKVKPNVGILCTCKEKIIIVRQGNYFACCFTPEDKEDIRIYEYFFDMVTDHILSY